MSSISSFIRSLIQQDGPIPVSRFFDLALSGRDDSYYMNRDPIGPRGDFITAPEISQVFGECVGAWCIDVWQQMGSPEAFRLVELGPGRGTLMADILRTARVHRPFLDACSIGLVEVSPFLRGCQRERLEAHAARVSWFDRVDAVHVDLPMIVVANEFFDALPARQFVKTVDGWFERCVGLNNEGALCFGVLRDADVTSRIPRPIQTAPSGSVFEFSDAGVSVAGIIGRALAARGGALLAIDYGYEGPAIGDTLQALKSHQYVPVLENAGEGDLTFHVDFSALAEALAAQGLRCAPLAEQRELLHRLGARERTEQLKSGATPSQASQLDHALARLTSPDAMGTLFKALCAVSPTGLLPAGFANP